MPSYQPGTMPSINDHARIRVLQVKLCFLITPHEKVDLCMAYTSEIENMQNFEIRTFCMTWVMHSQRDLTGKEILRRKCPSTEPATASTQRGRANR